MDHAAVYNKLIDRARGRILDGYTERHHVLPRCIGGGNEADNVVRLTPEEHFVAHQLLVHMHPDRHRLVFGMLAMTRNKMGLRPNNKLFGWMRRRMAEATRAMKTGVPRSPETVEKQRRSLLGRKAPPEQVEKMRAALTGKPKTPEHNAKVGRKGRRSPMTGRVHSEETKAKMRAAATGRKMSPEAVQKVIDSQTPEQRSARAHKAWETKRAKAAQPSLF